MSQGSVNRKGQARGAREAGGYAGRAARLSSAALSGLCGLCVPPPGGRSNFRGRVVVKGDMSTRVLFALVVCSVSLTAQNRPAPTKTEIAPGIVMFGTAVLNYGRGVTPGDAFVHLPRERVLLIGDLIVNPVTFALSGYPSEWLRVLERIDALDVETIVTGHGAPLHDKKLLRATMDVFRVLLREGRAAKEKGLTADQAKDAIFPGLHDQMVAITGDVPAVNAAFKQQLIDWYLHRVYEELDGPLTDAIAAIPRQ
jgi:hypothetical protein